jgi:HSP20 family protein
MSPSFLEKLKGEAGFEPVEERSQIKEKPQKKPKQKKVEQQKRLLKPEEGQLAIDVYQTNSEIVIITPIARVKAEDLDISIEGDVVTIRGTREAPEVEKEAKEFLYQECHWGTFSRQVILPEEVDSSRASASLKEGVLILKLPKIEASKKRKIAIKEVKSGS